MDFSKAFNLMKDGELVYRTGWNGSIAGIIMYVFIATSEDVLATYKLAPFFTYYNAKDNSHNVWMPSMWDMMGEDWEIYKE